MNPPAYLQARDGAVFLTVKAQPRARSTEIAGLHGDALKVRISAPPVDSAANEALRDAVAAWLGCPRSAVTLVRGATSPHKVLRLDGVTLERAAERLRP